MNAYISYDYNVSNNNIYVRIYILIPNLDRECVFYFWEYLYPKENIESDFINSTSIVSEVTI
jgi:hypothetical protein